MASCRSLSRLWSAAPVRISRAGLEGLQCRADKTCDVGIACRHEQSPPLVCSHNVGTMHRLGDAVTLQQHVQGGCRRPARHGKG